MLHHIKQWRILELQKGAGLFLITLLTAIFLKGFILNVDDPYKCKALISEGQWYHGHWLTPGCVNENLHLETIQSCLDGRKIVLVGDEELQGTFWALAAAFDGNVDRNQEPVQKDLQYVNDHVEIRYHWDPRLNGSEYVNSLADYRDALSAVTIVGGGFGGADKVAPGLSAALDRVAAFSSVSVDDTTLTARNGLRDLLLVAPAPSASKRQSSSTSFAPESINDYIQKLASRHPIDVVWNFNQIKAGNGDAVQVSRARADVILNLRCNWRAASEQSFPNTRTCCGTWAGPNWIQTAWLALALGFLPVLVLLDAMRPTLASGNRTLLRALCGFTSMIALQFVTDRTHVFEQVQRLPLEHLNLQSMIAIVVLIGVVSFRRCAPARKLAPGDKAPDQSFLSRDQSDEWKGWMQLLIIVYHYNMAWTALWFWEIIRLAVSSYLFLTGFGHTLYFLQKSDYSLQRVTAVMIRTNLLPVALAYVMRTRWLLYYYMPLSTFWFLVVWLTLATHAQWNVYRSFVICKILLSAYLVRTFIYTQGLPQTVVRFFELTCGMSFDANDFFGHRVQMDEYIVYVGMLAAILYIWIKESLAGKGVQDSVSTILRRSWPAVKIFAIITSGIAFTCFWYWVRININTGDQWSRLQPYISFIPISAFLVLRNAHPVLRNYHSAAFAWLGRYSGEMYVMQDHLWLSGDQEAVLRTGFFHGNETVAHDRWKDLVLITPMYLIACCILGDATAAIANWFVQEESAPTKGSAGSQVASEVEMGLLSSAGTDEDGDVLETKTRPYGIVERAGETLRPKTLRARVLVVLAVMWSLNMAYT